MLIKIMKIIQIQFQQILYKKIQNHNDDGKIKKTFKSIYTNHIIEQNIKGLFKNNYYT